MPTRTPYAWRMGRRSARSLSCLVGLLGTSVLCCGCTTLTDYIHNGFKVGPEYHQPPAPVAKEWIDANDVRVRQDSDDLKQWWTVFNDPVLNKLICFAYEQNLTLRQAGLRILSRPGGQLAISKGELFPQKQAFGADYTRNGFSVATANGTVISPLGSVPLRSKASQWDLGFGLNWELDFWGRFRRAVEADAANLDASVANYDDVLVTLLGDVASNYVQIRTLETRIKYANDNVALQRETMLLAEARVKAMVEDELNLDQARATLAQTESQIPELEISLRQTNNRLCILLGIPPEELKAKIGPRVDSDKGSGRGRRHSWPTRFRAAVRMCAVPSGRPLPRALKLAWPNPTSIRTLRSSATSAIPPISSRNSSVRRPSRERSARRFSGTSSIMVAS